MFDCEVHWLKPSKCDRGFCQKDERSMKCHEIQKFPNYMSKYKLERSCEFSVQIIVDASKNRKTKSKWNFLLV